ncbi:hypothetical protein CFOL_v3_17303 [Cephalotus follicularis]|uniref:Putative plant transposon protein domain-containing protein n=1 Tax=Cephalotus follicularis TaxID=3775 RepID=A0A1Q3C0N7_CEPFO|nr:hypothetical protein CFOL_v3_17303 [Cephalotus follicularis]
MVRTKGLEQGEGSKSKKKSVGKKGKEKAAATTSSTVPEVSAPKPRYPEAYFNRKILVGKVLDFAFCSREGFPLVKWLRFQGLEPLFSLNLASYPDLMKEFYAKITTSSSYTTAGISTTVKGKCIEFDLDKLHSILKIPNLGVKGWNQRTWVSGDGFDRLDCVRVLFGENDEPLQRMYTRNLPLHYRFLHRAICTHILPKAGGFDEVTHMEAFTLYHFVTSRPINVLFLIVKYMHSIHDRENARLGYSNIITRILSCFGVDFTGEVHNDLQSSDKLGKGTLARMGFKKHKRTGAWIPRDEDSNRIEQEEGEAEAGEEAENAPLQIEPPPQQIPHEHPPRDRTDEIFEAITGMQKNIECMKRRQKRFLKRFADAGLIVYDGLISPSSSHDDPPDDAATDDMEGDLGGDDAGTRMED